MSFPFVVAFRIFAFYVLFRATSAILASWRHATQARKLGCSEVPKMNGSGFLGLSAVWQFLKADSEKSLPYYLANIMQQASEQEERQVTTVGLNIAGGINYFTTDSKNIQAVLATQFSHFELGKARNEGFMPFLGKGLFTTDGKEWEHARASVRPHLTKGVISNLDLQERHLQNLLRVMAIKFDGWTNIADIQTLFFRLTLDFSSEFFFGQSTNSQLAVLPDYPVETPTLPSGKDFAYAFDRCQEYIAHGTRYNDYSWWAYNREFYQMCKEIHQVLDRFIQQALEPVKEQKFSTNRAILDKGGMEPARVFLHDLAEKTSEITEMRSQLLNLLIAGRDTTASLLSWLFLLLAQHPHVHATLRTEVIASFGTYSSPRDISFSTLRKCSYLQYTINEVLRLFPPLPLNRRRAKVDTTLPRGGGPDGLSPIYIRKDDDVLYSVHVMHRRKDLWGPDADEFRPERWKDRKFGWDYLPFNGGPRICVGQQLAITETSYIIVRLMQRFDTIEGYGVQPLGEPIRHGLSLANRPADGVKVRLRVARE